MPIRKEWREFYRGPEWEAAKARVLERAKSRCEQCGKPRGEIVWTYTWKTRQLKFGGRWNYHMVWIRDIGASHRAWRDQYGRLLSRDRWPAKGLPRRIKAQIGVAHLNHTPGDNRIENLRALCNFCHLHYDRLQHGQRRKTKKDESRPIAAACVDYAQGGI